MTRLIQFKPHHFLCSLAYQGMGYSLTFTKNYDRIIKDIRNNENTLIRVTFELDDICKKCPHEDGVSKKCKSQPLIEKLDNAHASILNFYDGELLSFKEAKERIRTSMSLEQFHQACGACEWKKLGVCEQALITLKGSKFKL